MKTLEEVCNELLFETEENAQQILSNHFPGYKVTIDNINTGHIFDQSGIEVATIFLKSVNHEG